MKYLCRLLLIALLFTSCSEVDEWSDSVIIVAKQISGSDSMSSGSITISEVSAITNGVTTLEEIQASSIDQVSGITDYGSYDASGTKYTLVFEYAVPEYTESDVVVTLRFMALDNEGNSDTYSTSLTITNSYNPLTERSNLTMYGANSGFANGYNFELNEWVYCDGTKATESDTDVDTEADADLDIDSSSTATIADIYDVKPESGEELSCIWKSMSGLKFARLTGFDYSSATNTSIAQGWALATKYDQITNISNDDIIFVGDSEDGVTAAIKINNIYDDAGVANDRYNISIKALNSNN